RESRPWSRCRRCRFAQSSSALFRFAGVAFAGLALGLARCAACLRREGFGSPSGPRTSRFRFVACIARPPVSAPDMAFGQKLEPQRACDRGSFYQTNLDDVTQPVHGTAARTDQRVAGLVKVEILAADGADRDQAVGAGI